MDPSDIGLFQQAERRLAWVDQRQQLLAQNVANANTPGYQPKDVASFEGTMRAVALANTSPMHLAAVAQVASRALERQSEVSPTGNGVSLEAQMGKVADTASIQQLVLNVEKSYMGMFRTVLGRAG